MLKTTLQIEQNRESTKSDIVTLKWKLLKKCPSLQSLTQKLRVEHFQWQRDTILISFARKDSVQNIQSSIQTGYDTRCMLCGDKGHHTELCIVNKERLKQNRLMAAINLRKSHMCGLYANSSPLHLLTHTLIPQEVFQEYSERFIPFFPGNS